MSARARFAWAEEYRERVGFSIQLFPIHTKGPSRHVLAAGRLADDLSLDAFFIGDHPAWNIDPWVHLAAVAATTRRIRLGSVVNCVAYRHPVLTARLAADLDNLSGGRLILGLGCGWDANEYASFGLTLPPASERLAALEEALVLIRGAWGDEPFSFEGRYYHTIGAHVAPPPVQRPSPPLLIAGGGERVTLRQVAQYADACNLAPFDVVGGTRTAADVRQKLAVLRRHCDELGRPYDTVLRTHMIGWLILAEDEAQLTAKVRCLVPEGLERRYTGPWAGFAFAGTPEQAIAYYRGLVDAGIQFFIAQLMDAADLETIRILAQQVAPAVQRYSAAHNR